MKNKLGCDTIMEIRNYIEKKEKGLAEVVKAGGGYAFAIKKFNIHDGSELKPELEAIDIEEVKQRKAELLREIADFETLITDLKALST